ncbi:alpha/beta fold hydrolase [Kribbella soli]|uniref:Alpha/beta fold hydrolase n=1 Tax=Kribbella soli TaxID=1124743 RepID=A0A4R0HRH0_9ACTN|nr:alpha/beta hydrolase [Kribbella soli]TCC11922.1 alpha/beta fold hydrolase [Kribbella soli]
MNAPVVLVPGLGLGPESYARTVEHLVTPYHVVTLPGYGEPAGTREDLHPRALAVTLAGKIRERSVLVGHSASCQIVVEMAIRYPELAHALVLAAPTGDVRLSSWVDRAVRLVGSAIPDAPKLVRISPQYARTTLPSIARAGEASRHHDLAAVMAHVQAPVVLVRGRHDLLCTAEWVERLAELSHGEARTLDSGAHMPVVTNGPELAALIERAAALPESR